ncbi:Tigger transposable element-derived protein 6 [Trichinella nelsoni]|uniref:Tigger transposable element-derived protein 6 n=1 Tax=Trichinella nelsoni TaxID=6336 RepID=A0A0V0SDT8_9BILA|nr:Tigger transposable element-derived protein 6 [Trichinella nelsoni]
MVRDEHKVVSFATKQVRISNLPVDGTIVRSKAAELAHLIGIDDFKASNGWINRFRQRHGLVYRSVRDRLIRVRLTRGRTDCKFCLTITNHPDDVLNDDEMGLFYRENSTILLCCNENGTEMLRTLVIGRAKNPR